MKIDPPADEKFPIYKPVPVNPRLLTSKGSNANPYVRFIGFTKKG